MYNIYRHINKSGEIIYIGKSKNLLSRQRNHRDNSSWFSEVENIEYITLDSKIEMDIAELYLINKFSPINNKKDNRADMVNIVEINCEWIKFNMSELDIKNKIKFSKSSIFNSKDGLKLNKDLVLNIGLYEAFFLSILFDESKNETNVWFELTMERVINNYNMSRHKQDEAIKKLKSLGLIDTKLTGMPSRRSFMITVD